jgi:long-chain acyl-CoA synthetase
VDNVCVYAFPQKSKPIAIVVPEEKALRAVIKKKGIASEHADIEQLVKMDQVKEMVMKDMLAAGKLAGLQGIELVSGVVLAHEPWTPENVILLHWINSDGRDLSPPR